MRKIIMKKYLFLIAFCVSSFVHGNGFDNLKNIQNNFHALIYQAGDLGAQQPAPEVPYIAGLLGNQIDSISKDAESRYIYETLYDRSAEGGKRKAIQGIDQAKADAFDALSFDDFARYDGYQNSGHSVLGVAAQEIADPVSRSPSSLSSSTLSSASLKSGGVSLPMAAGDVSSAEVQSKINQLQASILPSDRAKKTKTILEMQTDIAILTELVSELNSNVRIVDTEGEIFDRLNEFYNYLQSDDPKVLMKLGVLRKQLKSAIDSRTSTASAVASQPSGPVAVTLSPLQRVRAKLSELRSNNPTKQKEIQDKNADIEILAELEEELSVASSRSADENERFDDLMKFLELLENFAKPGQKKVEAEAAVANLRRALKIKSSQASISSTPVSGMGTGDRSGAPSPVAMQVDKNAMVDEAFQKAIQKQPMQSPFEKAIDQCVNDNIAGVPSAITDDRQVLQRLIKSLEALNPKTANQASNLGKLRARAPLVGDESDDDDGSETIVILSDQTLNALSTWDLNQEIRKLTQARGLSDGDDFEELDKIEKIDRAIANIKRIILEKGEDYLTDEELEIAQGKIMHDTKGGIIEPIKLLQIQNYKGWRNRREVPPAEARKAIGSRFPPKYLGKPYDPLTDDGKPAVVKEEEYLTDEELNSIPSRILSDAKKTTYRSLRSSGTSTAERLRVTAGSKFPAKYKNELYEMHEKPDVTWMISGPAAAPAPVPGGGGKTSQGQNTLQTRSSIGLAQSIIQRRNQAAGGGGSTPAPGLNIPQRSNQAAGGGGSVATGGAASSERQIVDEMKAIADQGGKYELVIKQYLERLIVGGAEGVSERRSYLDNLLVTLGSLKSSDYYMDKFVGVSRSRVGPQIDAIISEIKKQTGAQRNII
jgi:hypothetical protein